MIVFKNSCGNFELVILINEKILTQALFGMVRVHELPNWRACIFWLAKTFNSNNSSLRFCSAAT